MAIAFLYGLTMARERKTRSFKIDSAVLDSLTKGAKKHNSSVNRLVESILMEWCKAEGVMDFSVEPLGELRGKKNDSNSD
ncbi:hypothetical protein G7B40_041155 [Aetokthonos hydrillicola Thurmond2011]|jgi:hypothetical protein|uniref:Uncharacterized protein n=1 Tax=Aetokthonos hydrillicola Thurmond2011 TaxID=2712845 RepID=A0AAP5IFQ6_9CYAN|nr:hypothetical protein [Aetokthonos hydrillicola]MBW4591127.1 hypothetical protein [Aetokthonos hydrillicola CCALA 1050]MDR9900896.1 hypothetical protein [Aetokthonos hydrillicola Thurmond2011]